MKASDYNPYFLYNWEVLPQDQNRQEQALLFFFFYLISSVDERKADREKYLKSNISNSFDPRQ